MTKYVDTYCPECDAEVQARLHTAPVTLSIRGEEVPYSELVATCPTCGSIIGDARIEGENLERAYAVYRTSHGVMSPDEIKDLRTSYGLSLREFSKFLGFGEQTAYRYERGDLPDQTHSHTLRSATTTNGARLLLSQNRTKLSDRSITRIEQRINAMEAGASEEARLHFTLEEREAESPSSSNGYRRLNLERVMALVYTLACKCKDLYWTKLQKAAFFVDMAYFELNSQSLTGLRYAHATHGPIIDRKEEIYYILAERGVVDFRERGWGEVLTPLQYDKNPFTEDELAFIDKIAEFVNTFSTANGLSDYSHGLSCWSESVDGEIIEYTRNNGEVTKAVNDRMKSRKMA